jgi:hypothetical protein
MSSDLFFIVFEWVTNTIELGYPIWRSYKVLEAKKFDNELIQWLTFWVLVSSLSKTEDALQVIGISLRTFFMYRLSRLMLIAWMIHPKYQGALYLYFT